MGKSFLTLLGLFSFLQVQAQVDFSSALWHDIDSSLQHKTSQKSLSHRVDELIPVAIEQGNFLAAARCIDYQVRLRDQLTEDSLFFYNSMTADSLLGLPSLSAEFKTALHLLMARRLTLFTRKGLRFNRKLYERKDLPVNYAALSNAELLQLARQHFEAAKKLAPGLLSIPVPDMIWMSSDPLQFLFRPELYDIIIAEQIHLEGNGYSYDNSFSSEGATVLDYSPDEFISRIGSFTFTDSSKQFVLRLYSEWLDYHRRSPSTYYFIESLARKFCFEQTQPGYNKNEIWLTKYEQYLAGRIGSSYTAVKAYAVYQLCLIWNQQAKKYCPEFGYDYYSYRPKDKREFDTAWRYHGAKALQLFRDNYASLDSFAYLRNILTRMEGQLRQPETELHLEEFTVPGKPLLGELRFRNTDTLYYRIVQCNYQFRFFYTSQEQYFKQILSLPVVRDIRQALPTRPDFNRHISYLKLDALPVGFYYIVFSDQPLGPDNKRMKQASFKVSGLAAVENGDRVYVLDRQTGMPVKEALVNTKYTVKNKKGMDSTMYQLYQTNQAGYTVLRDGRIEEAEIYKNGDTILIDNIRVRANEEDEDVYSKDDYDDLAEYFEEHAEMHIYTDRSIYRPGQTVFYKAIILTRNPETGEPVLMNPANMGRGLFKHAYKKWLKGSEPLLYLEDALGKTIDSVYFKPDAFGSISGSFKIPLSAATGEWEISPDYIDKRWDNGNFRVEEYKRPSYEITLGKPVRIFNPGDSLEFNVKLRSFAGAALNNVPVKYTLTANGSIPGYADQLKHSSYREIADTTVLTDKDGELLIRMKDPFFTSSLQLPDTSWRIVYTLQAEAHDPSGEVYEKESSLTVSSRPVTILYNGPDKINRSRETRVGFSTKDLNAGLVARKVQVKIYRLKADEQLWNDRVLLPADTWLYTRGELGTWFPSCTFSSGVNTDPVLIGTYELSSAAGELLKLDSAMLTPGLYKMEVLCTENGMKQGRLEKNFSVFDEAEHRLPAASGDFHYLPVNSYLPGEKIKMFNGFPGKEVFVIREMQYYTTRQKRLITRVYQEDIQPAGLQCWEWKIPKDVLNQVLISQLIIYGNQLYQFKETVYVNDKKEVEPEIIVERYRSRLQPGAQETFAVSIRTMNPKAVAELMTVMYDASLDNLEPHKWEKPVSDRYRNISSEWNNRINDPVRSYAVESGLPNYEATMTSPGPSTALWWLNPQDYTDVVGEWNRKGSRTGDIDYDLITDDRGNTYAGNVLGRIPGISLASSQGLNEVVVVGYGVNVNRALAGKVAGVFVTIRGMSSLSGYAQPLIVLDGVVYEGDLSKLDPALITAALVLKGADASAIYGSRAANGVLILSTKGEIILPGQESPPPVPPRKNFNETAFFFPSVHADKDGYFSFSFTMPESVAEWNWKMLAHTSKAKFAYTERKLQTQLPLMIQASVPRVFYQGDRLILKHRISNLDTTEVAGQVTCKLEDVVTGEDLSSAFRFTGSDRFALAAKATGYTATEIRVPAGQLNPVKLIITVRSKQFADGEEHVLPVLSKNVFV
ncbi:MAG: TonB-dependent receptor plug domain-containing protein [Sphingobacteriales bacterium]|nr:TonB-dependent receptor plug domain-containing protein [Sphingobacteriales bacterium]